MKMKKTLVLASAMLLGVGTLVGCHKRFDGIILWCPLGDPYYNVFKSAVDRYVAANPETKIQIEQNNIDDVTALRTKINDSSSCPDIAICDHIYTTPLADSGLLVDLTEYNSGELEDLVPEGIYNACLYNDKLYSLPLSANTFILWGNKDILKDNGIESMPSTLDELLDDLQILEDGGIQAPMLMPVGTRSLAWIDLVVQSYIARRGGKICSDDYRTITLTDKNTLQAFYDYYDIASHITNDSYKTSYEEEAFYSREDAAFIEMGAWNLEKLQIQNPEFAPVVSCGGVNFSGLGLYNFVIPKKSKLIPEAYKLANFLSTDTEFQIAYSKVENLFPVTDEALADPYFTENPILEIYSEQLAKVSARPAHPCWASAIQPNLADLIYSIVNECYSHNDVKECVIDFEMTIQELVNQYFDL